MIPIIIPGRIQRFLDQRANVAFAGTRNRDLVPHGHRVSGWLIGADGRSITALIAMYFTSHLVDSLQDNGELALTVEEFPSHEAYQFKGHYRLHRAVQAEDLEVFGRIRDRFLKSARHIYTDAPEHLLSAYTVAPATAVEFEVREIYLQTPGPGAGTRLVPPVEPGPL